MAVVERRPAIYSGSRIPHPIPTVLENGEAGLIVIYAANMADQVAASIKAENRYISDAIDADADELEKQLKAES